VTLNVLVDVLPVGGMILDAFAAVAERQLARPADAATMPCVVERIESPAPSEDSSVPA